MGFLLSTDPSLCAESEDQTFFKWTALNPLVMSVAKINFKPKCSFLKYIHTLHFQLLKMHFLTNLRHFKLIS